MTEGIRTIIYPVKDIVRAKGLFSKFLGVKPSMDEAYYVGFIVGGQDIGLDPNGHSQGMTGPVGYWHVDDIKKRSCSSTPAPKHSRRSKTSVGGS